MIRKTILVDIYLAKNLGDDLFLDHLSRSFPDIVFVPFHPGTNYNSFFENYTNVVQFPYSIIDKIAARLGKDKLNNFDYLSGKYDGLLFLGGGIFREESYWKEVYQYRSKITEAFISRNKRVYFSGCSFGPYSSVQFLEAHKILFQRIDKITFRDRKSYTLFSDIKSTSYAPDLLWSYDLPKVEKSEKVLGISVIDPNHKQNYKSTYQEYLNVHKELCEDYLKLGYRIRLFSFCEAEGDLTMAEAIAGDSSSIEIYNYTSDISTYLKEMGTCSTFIAARFHAVILAFKFHIPVVPVIYGDKTENMLRDLDFNSPFVFLDSISTLHGAAALELDEERIKMLKKESKLHFNLEF